MANDPEPHRPYTRLIAEWKQRWSETPQRWCSYKKILNERLLIMLLCLACLYLDHALGLRDNSILLFTDFHWYPTVMIWSYGFTKLLHPSSKTINEILKVAEEFWNCNKRSLRYFTCTYMSYSDVLSENINSDTDCYHIAKSTPVMSETF